MTSLANRQQLLSGSKKLTEKFHLSIGVKSLKESKEFYRDVIGADITYEGDYINIDFYGTQITLKDNPEINVDLPDLHFGVNLPLDKFKKLENNISMNHSKWIHTPIHIVDKGTEMERQKMYLNCPSGYLIEIKGYKKLS